MGHALKDLPEEIVRHEGREPPEVSVVIPTFRRPQKLRQALESCLDQQTASGQAYEIIVVDNAPEGSAAEVVAGACRSSHVAIRYVHEPRPGISHARNAGLASARGRFIAMIDDDEKADPQWLWHLTRTQRDHQADVVFGPVFPAFEREPERHAAFLRRFFTYSAYRPTGSRVGERSTNNALVSTACLPACPAFDARLGLTGGEDTLFFSRLRAQGACLVWCAEAQVSEAVPTERTTWRYVWRRAFQRGQCRAGTPMLLEPPVRRRTAFWMAVGATQSVAFGLIAGMLRLVGAQAAPCFAARAAGGIGKVLWMRRFRKTAYGDGPQTTDGDAGARAPASLRSSIPEGR